MTRFDRIALAVIAALAAALLLVIALGDRVGVQIVRVTPTGPAASTASVAIQFSEPMDWASVTARFSLAPPAAGDFTWGGSTLRFRPAAPLTPGTTYTVTLASGAQARAGRAVLRPVSFSFTVRAPRVAYLAPSDAVPQNVWIADPADPASAQQLTFSPSNVLNFDISPDSTRLAFAERNSETGTSDIKLLDLQSGALQQLTNCPESDCDTPVWRPDGQMIAYQRVDYNTGLDALGASPTRVWLLDLTAIPATTRPLFADTQLLGYAPQWSADGARIAVFDNNSRGILVYDFNDDSTVLIPTQAGGGDISLSPDGARVVFPRLIVEGTEARSNLQMADLASGAVVDLTSPDERLDDTQSDWNPDGVRLALARRYLDERYTRTRQLYLLDTATGELTPLIADPRYFNGFFSWDPQGVRLVIQRFPELTADGQLNSSGRPEVWTYNLDSGALTLIAENAYLPRWAP